MRGLNTARFVINLFIERPELKVVQAFRQRKLAESGASMGYGGMA